ncbi:MAG: D-alanine--D-alanine ligase, partial [Eubacteriales bacterium]
MKILVLSGGISPERDVSLSSGAMIATALSERGHSVAYCDSYIGFDGDAQAQFKTGLTYSYTIPADEPELAALRREYSVRNGGGELGRGILDACRIADVVFIALHGGIGENGQLQATFDTFGIRYTGSAALASAMAMDKDISKRMFVQSGVPTAAWVYFDMKHTQKSDAVSIT